MARSPLIRDLRARLGAESVLSAPSELAVYDCDAFTIERQAPDAVVLPCSSRQVAEAVKVAQKHDVPLVPRGAGTSLAGGCIPVGGGIVALLTRMNQILEINLRDRTAVVEAGVPNIELTRRLAGTGYHYAPDPSSQGASTIGGNVATNAGGPHTLKYGVTVNHVLGIEAVLSDGSIMRFGPVENPGELDLIGLLVGGEGTLGIVTKVWVRLTPDPQDYRTMRAIFDTVEDATRAVSRIVAAGIIPAAMELMDQAIMTALEEAFHFGFPSDAGAILVIELDGPTVGLDAQQERIVEFCQDSGAREVLHAASPEERALLWKCRKSAAGALGRLSPNYFTQDGVVPRTRLPEIIRRIAEIGRKYQIGVVNVAHAGDGNVHPVLLTDERDPEQVQRALAAGRELLGACIECGGSVTAEHGIGVEKIALMDRLFTVDDLVAMARVRQSFDPTERFNPGKVLPSVVVRSAKQHSVRGSLREPAFVRGANNDYTTYAPPLTDTIAPADTAEVAQAVRSAYGNKTAIYAIGGGTALDYGGRPSQPGSGLSLEGLSRVVDYPADDMTITVEAGLTIAELAGRLQENHQRLPIDIPNADRATIGGAIAANAGGPRRYAHGTMRDYLIGFRAVDGTGTEFGGGGRVVKNAAGYDMCKLMIGSLGTLAVITQVTLMVRPVPEAFALVAGDVEDFKMAERLLAAVVHTKTLPVAVELLAGPTQPASPVLGPAAESSVARLVVGFEGSQSEVDWMVGRLRDEWSEQGVSTPVVISSAASSTTAQTAWKWLGELPADVQINVRPGATVAMIEHVLRLDPRCSIQSHAGNGVIRAKWSPTVLAASVSETVPAAAALCNGLRPAAADSGGVATMLSLPDDVELSTRDIWGPPRDAAVVMRAIKDRFDPRGILSPGRLDYGHFKTERPDHAIR